MADVEKAELTEKAGENSGLAPAPAYPDEPPPSYDSVVGRIRDVRSKSTDKKDMARKLAVMVFCNTINMTITIAVCIIVPIVNIVIGAVFLDDCPRERMIPVYLIVGGCFVFMRALLNIAELVQKQRMKEAEQEYQRSRLFTCCDFPVSLFLFVWFIAGNVWIFSIRHSFQSTDASLASYCHGTLYWYAYWLTIAAYIVMLAPLALCCCVSCVTCCGLCADDTDKRPTTTNN